MRSTTRLPRPVAIASACLAIAISLAGCVVPPGPPPPPTGPCPSGAARWSDPATWPGGVPTAGQDVTIENGTTVALDTDTAALGSLTIMGTLVACRQDVSLTSDWVVVHGALQAGTAADPFTHHLTITLTATDTAESVMGMGTRGILVMGGRLELFGDAPAVEWTKVDAHVAAGSSTLQLVEPVGWQPGDELAIAITDFYGTSQTERRTIASVNGTTVQLTSPLPAARWGRLQHVTTTGMSPTPGTAPTPSANPTPLVLDERAEVANLTRNIVIQAPNDAAWQTQGFGAHVMVMELSSSVQVDGVEFRRVGQRGILGRYPIHWHRLSYDAGTGAPLGDATGHSVRSSTFSPSANRCITLHATNGVAVQDNVCFDVAGHGVFTEDAVERRNVIERNLVMRVRNPANGFALKMHESNTETDGASSGFWLSNPDNVVRDNVASDAQGFGFWLAFPQNPVGVSSNVAIRPDRTLFGTFSGNTAHSNGRQGMMFDLAETDSLGNTFPHQYWSTTDGADPLWPYPNVRRFPVSRVTLYKNGFGGLWNRVTNADYSELVNADNEGRYFAGGGAGSVISRTLLVGTSLNAPTPRPHAWAGPPAAFASYHSSIDMRDNVIVNFPLLPGERSGAFDTWDYYITPVDKGHIRNPGNVLIASDPGYRHPRPSPNYALAGALWDPYGTYGPAGNYNVYDDPFLTNGATCQAIAPAGSNGVSCTGPYYGVQGFVLDQGNERWAAMMPIAVTRYDAAGAVVGTWSVADGNLIDAFGNMRHFAARDGGRYLLDFPASTTPGDVGLTLTNLFGVDDDIVLGIRFAGGDPAQVYSSTYWDYDDAGHAASPPSAIKHDYTPAASLAAVVASAGETYWQDVAGNVVWTKVRGGLSQTWNDADYPEFSDERLYRAMYLRVH